MSNELDMSGDLNVSSFINAEGQFLFCTTSVNEQPVDANNVAINGLEFTAEVLGGTAPGQEGNRLIEVFRDPSPQHKDGGEFATKIRRRLVIAHGLVPVKFDAEGKAVVDPQYAGRVQIDWQHCNARLWVGFVKAETYKKKDGSESVSHRINGAHIYNIYDPAVKHVIAAAMKNERAKKALAMFGMTDVPQTPVAPAASTNGNGAAVASAAPAVTAAPAPAANPNEWKL